VRQREAAAVRLGLVNPRLDRARIALLALLAAVLGVGLWTYRGVGESLRETRSASLKSLLDTQVEAIERWIAEGRHEAGQLAADPQLRTAIASLAAGASGRGEAERIIARLIETAGAIGMTSARVLDARGALLASSDVPEIGQGVPQEFLARLAPAFAGRPIFVPPRHGGAQPKRTWIVAPVREAGGRIVALIALGSAAEKGFSDLFKAARSGRTGEPFAFDADGWLLSESRHAEELRSRGLAPRLTQTGAEAFTRLALAATGARAGGASTGVLPEPYPNHLGRDSIGAWRWLRDHDIGIGVEMEAAEAYAPLTHLRTGFFVLALLIAAVWLSGFLPPKVLAELLRRSGRERQLGPYRLARRIGEGAISNVYLARHRMLKRPAAVKVLKPQASSDEWIARFQREVQLASALGHPNTIRIYDYGIGPDNEFWYAMEYLEGLSLGDLVERYGPVPPSRTAWILRQACASLWEAHSGGIVHRDIKPQNIMLCEIHGERDVVKVLDFGLVKQISGEHTRDLTGTMRILGTPLYMSPERIRHPGDADARSDIYALGAVGFWLLTGKRVFETETEHDLIYQVLHTVPPLASEVSHFTVPVELDALIGRCLEKDPDRRPQSMAEVASALDAVLVYQPWTRAQIDAWWEKHWVPEGHPERRLTSANP